MAYLQDDADEAEQALGSAVIALACLLVGAALLTGSCVVKGLRKESADISASDHQLVMAVEQTKAAYQLTRLANAMERLQVQLIRPAPAAASRPQLIPACPPAPVCSGGGFQLFPGGSTEVKVFSGPATAK